MMRRHHTRTAAGSTDMDASFWKTRWKNGRTRWDRGAPSPALEHWLGHAAALPARMLVPGCGSGHEVEWLTRRGVAVTGVDIVATPLEALHARLDTQGLAAELVCGDLFAWEPAAPFDAIYEQTCLCAIDPVRRPDYAARLHRWLAPGGTLYALFAQIDARDGPPWHCDIGAMRTLFPDTLWLWPDRADCSIPHPVGFEELGFRLVRRSTLAD